MGWGEMGECQGLSSYMCEVLHSVATQQADNQIHKRGPWEMRRRPSSLTQGTEERGPRGAGGENIS